MSQIHILDNQDHTILDYITAKNIIDDNHKKSIEDSLETYNFITFADKRFSEFLEKRNRIIIPDEDDTLREFVIFEAAKYRDTEGYKARVYTHASYLELKKASILYPDTHEGTASQLGGRALNDTGWQMGIVESKGTRTLTIESHTNPFAFLKRIAKEFDLELRFRVEHDGNKIIGRYVDLLEQVGEWRGREVEFGKDLDGIERVEKQDIVTALLGLGPEDEDGNRLEIFVEDEDALKRWGRLDEHGNLHHLIEAYEIQSSRTEMTEEEARQYTRTALNKRIDTQVTYETTIIDLENVPGMENKKIRFGDTIKIKDTKFVPPLYLEARVFEQTRSIKSKAKKDIKLGDYIEHTEEEVNAIWKQLQSEIRKRVSKYEMMEYTYDKVTIDDKDEQTYEDGKTFAEATGVKAEDNAKDYADEQDEKLESSVKDYADDVAEQKADSAYDKAKQYAVAKEVYENQMDKIAKDMADKADLEYIDGKLVDKVNKGDVYEIEDIDNMINNTVSKTVYETDKEGIVTDLESHGTRLGQNEKAIGLKADSTDLNAVENSLEKKIGNVEVKADEVEISVSEVRADLDGLEIGGRNIFYNSSFFDGMRSWTRSNIKEYVINGNEITLTSQANGSWPRLQNKSESITKIKEGVKYVISFEFKGDSGSSSICRISSTSGANVIFTSPTIPYTGEWQKFEYAFTSKNNADKDSQFEVWIDGNNTGVERTRSYRNFQLELGTLATDWSPAPEDVDGKIETLDGEITTLAGEVKLKASQSIVDSLEGRVETAEGELRVLPGEIDARVSKDGVVGAINATPEELLIDFEKVKITNQLEAKHIKSLNGLNINDEFIVDNRGNVEFKGELNGATGTFKGEVQAAQLIVNNPNLSTEGATGLKLELARNREVLPDPHVKTGYAVFSSEHDGIIIYKENLKGGDERLDFFNIEADRFLINGRIEVGLDGDGGSEFGLKFPKLHSIAASPSDGHFSFYGNRANGQRPFHIRSHNNEQSGSGNNSYRDEFYLGSSGLIYSPPTYNETTSYSANLRISGSYRIRRISSARKYKLLEEPVKVDPYQIHNVLPKTWYDKGAAEKLAKTMNMELKGLPIFDDDEVSGIERVAGLIAEDVEDAGLSLFVEYNKEGVVEGIQYDRLWTLLIPISKDHEVKIYDLEVKAREIEVTLSDHEKKINTLEKKVETQQEEINQLKGVA